MLVESFLLILLVARLVAVIINTVKCFVAWYFVFHVVKKCKRLPFFS